MDCVVVGRVVGIGGNGCRSKSAMIPKIIPPTNMLSTTIDPRAIALNGSVKGATEQLQ